MTERLKAPVEPAVLAWGRKSAALSLAEAANEGGFAPYRYQVLSHLGRSFARLILQGYSQNRLNLSAVAGYLGVQAKHAEHRRCTAWIVSP
jgi:hypothetical protein